MQKLAPTLYQIISTDYLAQNLFVMIFGGWVIYFIDALFEGETTFILLIAAALCTLIGLPAFLWRHNQIISTFLEGMEIDGHITEIHTISTGKKRRDYVIDYEYQVDGQMYQSRNRVKKNAFARALKQGQKVSIAVNARNPNVAFLKDMYIVFI